jgi:hypothetical protein
MSLVKAIGIFLLMPGSFLIPMLAIQFISGATGIGFFTVTGIAMALGIGLICLK